MKFFPANNIEPVTLHAPEKKHINLDSKTFNENNH